MKSLQQNTSFVSLNFEVFKLKSSFSQTNGSEEEVLKILVLKLGQCVDHARLFCLLKKYEWGI